MRRTLASLGLVLALAPLTAHAGIDRAGTTAANFLSIGSGAGVLGMGGAAIGGGRGLNAASWNVASLAGLGHTEYVFSHASLTGESPQEWVAAGGRLGLSHARWGAYALYQGDGSFEGRDASNNPTGSFSASSMAIGGQFAQALGPMGSVGLGVKYVSEKLGSVSGGGLAFDAGVQLRAGALGFGAAAQNAFGKMSYSGASFDFPANYGLGVAYHLPLTGVTLALDANFPAAYYSDVRGGVEWNWHDRVALRSGYRKEMGAGPGEPLGGPTFGMGAGANGFWFDYGYVVGGSAGAGQHRVGLTYRPGAFLLGADAEPDAVRPSTPPARAAVQAEPAPEKTPAKHRTPDPVAPVRVTTQNTTSMPGNAGIASQAPAPITVKTQNPAPVAPAPLAAAPVLTPRPQPVPVEIKPEPVVTRPVASTPVAKPEAPKPEAPVAKPEAPAPKLEPVAPAKTDEAPPPAPPVLAKPAPVPAPASPATPASRPDRIKVKSGETLASIAKQWGNSVAAIMMENNLVSEKVKPGKTLKLPAAGR